MGNIFTVGGSANGGVDGMKFVSFAAVPNILPLGQTELGNIRNKFTCWHNPEIFAFRHFSSSLRRSILHVPYSLLTALCFVFSRTCQNALLYAFSYIRNSNQTQVPRPPPAIMVLTCAALYYSVDLLNKKFSSL